MKPAILALILWVTFAVPSLAQTPAVPSSVDVYVLPAAGPSDTTLPIAGPRNTPVSDTSSNCNLAIPAPVVPPLNNPTTIFFDDPFHAGKTCSALLPATIPNGTGYRAMAVFVATTCTNIDGTPLTPCPGPRSAAGTPPFNVGVVLGRPVAPTGVRVTP